LEQAHTQTNQHHELEFLEQLVSIDSRSKKIEGVQKVQNLLAQKLEGLGFQLNFYKNPTHESAELLVGILPGTLQGQVAFIGHADTVLGPSSGHQYRLSADGSELLGPGVADNKGGLLVALRGIAQFLDYHVLRPTFVFVSSPNEELGSLGFHQQFNAIGASSDCVLGFEPALKTGQVLRGRHGNRWYRINIKGRAFHAGRFGEPSVNAAHELAFKITKLSELNCSKRKIKATVGSLKGGTGHFNVVCGEAEFQLDIRFPSLEIRDELHEKILTILNTPHVHCELTGETCQVSYQIEDDCPPMASSLDIDGLTDLYLQSIERVEGAGTTATFTGGAADINYFSTGHNFCLDGLGPIANGMHTVHESLDINSIFTRSRALSLFLYQFAHISLRPRSKQ
jgi:glutamate carboxypeptidase